MIGLFCRISSLLQSSFAKETYDVKSCYLTCKVHVTGRVKSYHFRSHSMKCHSVDPEHTVTSHHNTLQSFDNAYVQHVTLPQHTATHCNNTPQHTATTHCNTLQSFDNEYEKHITIQMQQHSAVHCNNTPQHIATTHRNTLQQHTATHCNNTLQHTATTHRSTLQ